MVQQDLRVKYVALRYFNAAGATENFGEDHHPESHLIPILLQVAQGKREKAMIFGDDYDTPDGTCIRDYIHILDLAQAHEKALYAPRSGHYNLGTGAGLSVKEILDTARKVTGHPIPADVVPRRPGRPAAPDRLLRSRQKGARMEAGIRECRSDYPVCLELASETSGTATGTDKNGVRMACHGAVYGI